MNREYYDFSLDKVHTRYFFVSEGKRGKIIKVVVFQEIDNHIFNVVLGDYDEINDKVDDENITNNGDMTKVFATVVHIIKDYLKKNPDKLLYIEANTPLKSKLYNRIIRNNLQELETHLNIFGVQEDETIELFLGAIEYKAIVLQLSNTK